MDLKELLKGAKSRRRRELVPEEVLDALGVPSDAPALYVSECSARDLDSYQAGRWRQVGGGRDQHAELDLTDERARLLVRCLADDKGERVFADDETDEVTTWPGAAANVLYQTAMRLCGLAQAEQEGAEKNESARPGG